MWLAAKVENLASSIWPPRSPAVATHVSVTMFTTLCFINPSCDARFSGTAPLETTHVRG